MKRRAQALTLKTADLKKLIVAEAVDTVLLHGVEGGFHILIGFGTEEKPLGLSRGDQERVFKTLQSAVNYLDRLGIAHASLDWTRHSPAVKPAKRSKGPGRAAARERTAEALAHDADYLQSVATAIAQIDAGTAKIIPWSPEENRAAGEEAIAWARAKKARQKEGSR